MEARGPKIPGARSSEKNPDFLKFIGPVTTLWVLQPSQTMHMVFTESLLARAVFRKSIKVLGWQPEAPKFREHDLPKKILIFLKFIGPATTVWVLQSSQNVHMVITEFLLARAVLTRLIRVLGWQPGTPKAREHDYPNKKTSRFFEFHRTSDTSMVSVAL